jgi:OmpR family two-component system response regulator YxdJ
VQLATTMRSGQRLLDTLQNGDQEFIVTSLDGSLSTRVRLSIDGMHADEEPVGAAQVAVDWSRSTISNGPSRVALSRTELLLLGALLAEAEAPISRAALIRNVWPADSLPISDRANALAVYVFSLRKRLATIGLEGALQTVRGVGYRLAF